MTSIPVSRWSPYCFGLCGSVGYILAPVTTVPVVVIITPSIAPGGAYGPTRCVLVDYITGRVTNSDVRKFGIVETRK